MTKKLLDTNIYIDLFFDPDSYDEIFRSEGHIYLSAVVLMELLAGAHSRGQKNNVYDLRDLFRRLGRITAPTTRDFELAGEILAKLQSQKGYNLKKAESIASDCLIAASARSIGAIVYTQNRKDFQAIKEVFDFQVTYISAKADGLQIDDST